MMRWASPKVPITFALRCATRNYDAVQVFKTGDPEALQLTHNIPSPPKVPSKQVRISIQKIGVNYHDTYTRSGLYPQPSLPFVVGCEASGEIIEVGEDTTTDFNIGDRVAFFHYNTGYATEAIIPQESCFVLPDGVSYEIGAASLVQGLTAHYLAHDSYTLGSGDTCLVHAAGGGTGNLLVQMAKLRGATVIATTSSNRDKADAAVKAGADHVVTYGDDYDFLSTVKDLCPQGFDVVYDSIGKATAASSLKSLKPRGTCVLYGNSSGAPDAILPTPTLAESSIYVQRPVLQHFLLDENERKKRSLDLFGWIRDGKLQIRISKTFALKDAADAHLYLESREALGKVLLDPLKV